MTLKRLIASLGIFAALAAAQGADPRDAAALQADFRSGAETDTFTVASEGGSLPGYSVQRSGAQELTVTFNRDGERAPAPPAISGSKLVAGVRPTPGGFKILLKTSAFGYVNFPNAAKNSLQIKIFPDAVGSSWGEARKDRAEPRNNAPDKKAEAAKKADALKAKAEAQAEKRRKTEAKAEAKPEAKPEAKSPAISEAKAQEDARNQAEAKARRERQTRPEPASAPQAHAAAVQPHAPLTPPPSASAAPVQAPVSAASAPAPQQASKPAPPAEGTHGQPFFSVPYSMRAPVSKAVLGAPTGATATLPPVAGQQQQPTPAPIAAQPVAPAAAVAQASPAPTPEKHQPERQLGGKVPAGVVEKPILQEQTTNAIPQERPAAPPPTSLPQPPQAPVDVQLAKGQTAVRFRAERRAPAESRPAEIISGGSAQPRAAGFPSAPGQQMPQGPPALAQPMPNKPWEVRQAVQKTLIPTGAGASATLPQVGGTQQAAPHEAEAGPQPEAHAPSVGNASEHSPAAAGNASEHTPAATGNASEHAPAAPHAADAKPADGHGAEAKPADAHGAPAKGGGSHGGKDKEPAGPLTVDQIKDQILKAQSDMVAGNWLPAVKQLEDLMREPNMKGDLREDTLYSLADAYMQAYRDNPAANYDKIMGAQQAAMNANQKSHRVPKALINLGLLNLRVNNLPEATAYFNIVKKKYPQDQNAAIIPYSLGDYYREKGDLKKAADQFQHLIQAYPDSRMAKETAFALAQILRKLGSYEKGFQIIDYIDKRWPLFYMENSGFLKLAGEIEEKVGKLDQAKDHYWTFYNLKPDNDYADIVLVRIGDIYLRQNKRAAAKEIYQKTVHDFPNREGSLVARMRLAEEGIYDDPTMTEMGSVFGKPESLKPNETYEYIMNKHPQSLLAPLAQIKLGMWQFHTKSYLDAINTAGGFLQKYPKSPLIGKANELGFQAFLSALPQLVSEGNYQRVMQLYDSAPFVKDNQDKIGDEAQMAIAVSAWKRAQPDRALKLSGRFLGKKQVPKYSEMALDLAMNIFMERKDWKRISDLAAKAGSAWKLSPRQKAQFDSARAMALENQGETEKSIPLWTRIAADTTADPATRAYATYVLAKEAARSQDMHRLFALSQEALTQLLATGGDKDKIKDCMLMSITATERSGRYAETLKWASEFDRIIPDTDPDWAPVRLRLADIYRRGNQTADWKALLQDIVKKKPGTVYARMASQALESNALDKRLQNYLSPNAQQR